MNSDLIYTSIYGDYDHLQGIVRRTINTDYKIFTDCVEAIEPWVVKSVPRGKQDPRKVAKYYKILPPREYKRTLWIDGNIEPFFHSWEELELTIGGSKDLAFLKHPNRDCLYEEAEQCLRLGQDKEGVIEKQVARYRREGMPEHFGLWAGTIILRTDDKDVRGLMRFWKREIDKGSIRDQISLPYILWKSGYIPGIIRGNLWNHSLFKYNNHS